MKTPLYIKISILFVFALLTYTASAQVRSDCCPFDLHELGLVEQEIRVLNGNIYDLLDKFEVHSVIVQIRYRQLGKFREKSILFNFHEILDNKPRTFQLNDRLFIDKTLNGELSPFAFRLIYLRRGGKPDLATSFEVSLGNIDINVPAALAGNDELSVKKMEANYKSDPSSVSTLGNQLVPGKAIVELEKLLKQ